MYLNSSLKNGLFFFHYHLPSVHLLLINVTSMELRTDIMEKMIKFAVSVNLPS